ncbi:hypothetical protein M0P65_05205 [Candidatus Gracilibacteria bacterium]|nr:hypothetical protein [Candidatus Gracilibacteria bacterium]
MKKLVHQIVTKESDCRIEVSDNGETVIYTGLVKKNTKYRLARTEEQMDYIPIEELNKTE